MSTTENALNAHLVLRPVLSDTQITNLKHDARHRLQHRNISQATLETEPIAEEDRGATVVNYYDLRASVF